MVSRMRYFDNAATTQVLPEVAEAAYPYFCDNYGNPSSLHDLGFDAADAMLSSRGAVRDAFPGAPSSPLTPVGVS